MYSLTSGEFESGLVDLELLPTKVVLSWRIEKLFQRQIQVTGLLIVRCD